MRIGAPKETAQGEARVALTPESAERLQKLGYDCLVETGAGAAASITDAAYQAAGVKIVDSAAKLWSDADVIVKVREPSSEEIEAAPDGKTLISFIWPAANEALLEKLKEKNMSVLAMDMVPRISRAQKMDALSSQANLAGYVMVILAAEKLDRILPMMMTPAGTISPAKVFVIGAGVAGLQAIATAKRLGARVEAFDTRPVVAEQVRSVGGKFLEIDLGETGQTKDGYAKELTPEQIDKQRLGMKEVISQSDIVINTAQVFGRPAPRIITKDMVEAMKPGGVIVDMAVETGGNVEGSTPNKTVEINGISIIGVNNLPAVVAKDASQMYSANIYNFITEYWSEEEKILSLDLEDDILSGCIITHGGDLVNQTIKNLRN